MVGDVEMNVRYPKREKTHIIKIRTSFVRYELRIIPVILSSLILHTLEPSCPSLSDENDSPVSIHSTVPNYTREIYEIGEWKTIIRRLGMQTWI